MRPPLGLGPAAEEASRDQERISSPGCKPAFSAAYPASTDSTTTPSGSSMATGPRAGAFAIAVLEQKDSATRIQRVIFYRQSPNSSNAAQWKGWGEPDLPRI